MAHPAPPPPTDPEKHKDRSITWRSAVLSAGVVLLAGVVGAGSSYVVTNMQIESEAAQGREEFLRTQRQIAYAEMAKDSEAAKAVMDEWRGLATDELPTIEQSEDIHDRLAPIVTEISVDRITIQ